MPVAPLVLTLLAPQVLATRASRASSVQDVLRTDWPEEVGPVGQPALMSHVVGAALHAPGAAVVATETVKASTAYGADHSSLSGAAPGSASQVAKGADGRPKATIADERQQLTEWFEEVTGGAAHGRATLAVGNATAGAHAHGLAGAAAAPLEVITKGLSGLESFAASAMAALGHAASRKGINIGSMLQLAEQELGASDEDGRCWLADDGAVVGCRLSCQCGILERCYPKRVFKHQLVGHGRAAVDASSERIDAGVCGKKVSVLAMLSTMIFLLILGCVVTARMIFQRHEYASKMDMN